MKTIKPSRPDKRKSTWEDYSRMKAAISNRGLTPREYEKEIQRIAKRLGL